MAANDMRQTDPNIVFGADSIHLAGGRHAVLMLHGLSGTAFEVMHVAKGLNRQGYTVRIPVLPGHRASVSELSSTTWQDWYDAAEKHFEELSRSYDAVSVAGLCMGAVLSLRLAAEKKERVASLVLMSTTLAYDGWSIPWYSFLLPLVLHTPLKHLWSYKEGGSYGIKNEAMRKRVSAKMSDKSSVAYAKTPANSIREMLGLVKATKPRLAEISAPALILHAAQDEVASPKNAEYLQRHLGSAHIEKMILDDCYHMITIDNQRDLVAAEANRFIAAQGMAKCKAAIKPDEPRTRSNNPSTAEFLRACSL